MKNNFLSKLEISASSKSYVFEPTINIFNKGVVVNYKKVGTRFLAIISAGNETLNRVNSKQVDFIIKDDNIFENGTLTSEINYPYTTRYVYAPWHREPHTNSNIIDSYRNWKSDESFLTDNGFNNYTDFFFNNPNDIIFLVRNPIKRFFSGIIQILTEYCVSLSTDENEMKFFKSKTNYSDFDIYDITNIKNLLNEKIDYELINNLILYLLDYKLDLVLYDIHTENYLFNYIEWISNMNDKSKIKVIDLNHLRSKKSLKFFSDLRQDDLLDKTYRDINTLIDSNVHIYKNLLQDFESEETISSSFSNYIKGEYRIYKNLISSPYFVDLSD